MPRPQALSPPPSLPAWPTHGTEDTAAGDPYLELCWNREDLLLLGGQQGSEWGSVGLCPNAEARMGGGEEATRARPAQVTLGVSCRGGRASVGASSVYLPAS